MKVALVAILRDEAPDILAWLGWHIMTGVDTFILFDDGSKDGTLDLLRDAATLHDIRIYAIDYSVDPHLHRQRLAYTIALNGLQDEFDWVGLLDADEYLLLCRHKNLKEFLTGFGEDVGAVGINWCNYGSNGYVIKPIMPPFYAFTRHYLPDHYVNQHVKSFVRPASWSGEWNNFHYFENDRRYVNPDGHDIVWSETLGRTQGLPAWNTAKIMHYQLRSMEQYVERARRRSDILVRPEGFTQCDHNDLYDPRPFQHTTVVMDWVHRAVEQGCARTLDALDIEDFNEATHLPPSEPALRLLGIKPMEGDDLDIVNGSIHLVKDGENSHQLLALQIGEIKKKVFLIVINSEGNLINFRIDEDTRVLGNLSYELIATASPDLFALQQAAYKTYLTAMPLPHGGAVIADRRKIQEWELFRVRTFDRGEIIIKLYNSPFLTFLRRALSKPITIPTIARLAREDMRQTIACLPILLSAMSEEDAKTLKSRLGVLIRYIL